MQKTLIALVTVAVLGQVAEAKRTEAATVHPYVGMWVTKDGHIRHELLSNGRYVEAWHARTRL